MVAIFCYPIFNFADTLLEDAERIAKGIETLERDLKAAKPRRGGLTAKNQPLLGAVETVQQASITERKETIICQSFSDDNYKVAVSNDKRSVKSNGGRFVRGYSFLKHSKIKKDQILKWSIRVPKFKYGLGMVIILELIISFRNLISKNFFA